MSVDVFTVQGEKFGFPQRGVFDLLFNAEQVSLAYALKMAADNSLQNIGYESFGIAIPLAPQMAVHEAESMARLLVTARHWFSFLPESGGDSLRQLHDAFATVGTHPFHDAALCLVEMMGSQKPNGFDFARQMVGRYLGEAARLYKSRAPSRPTLARWWGIPRATVQTNFL